MAIFIKQCPKVLTLTIIVHSCLASKRSAIFSDSRIFDNVFVTNSTVDHDRKNAIDGLQSKCRNLQKYNYSVTYMTYMMNLRLCNLVKSNDWIEKKCQQNFFEGYLGYHQLINLKFCNESTYRIICGSPTSSANYLQNVTAILVWWTRYNDVPVPPSNFQKTKINIDSEKAKLKNRRLCFYIDAYFKTLVKGYESVWSIKTAFNRRKRERTFDLHRPFVNPNYSEVYVSDALCETICPVVLDQTDNRLLSRFGCYPSQCKAEVISILFSYSLLAIAIISTNTLVLIIAWKTNLLSTVSGLFRIHLAIADLLVGVSVIPAILGQYSRTHFSAATYAPVVRYTEWSNSTMESRLLVSSTAILYLFVSLYTLCIASIDRYLAITRPVLYRQGKYFNKKRVNLILGLGWMIGLLLAISGRISGLDNHRLILDLFTEPVSTLAFLVSVVVVLLLTWIFNGLTLRHIRKYYKERRTLFAGKSNRTKTSPNAISASNKTKICEGRKNEENLEVHILFPRSRFKSGHL